MDASNDKDSGKVDAYLSLLTTINNRIEDILGSASKGLIFSTGVEEGKRIGEGFDKTQTIQSAIEMLNEAYEGVWSIELNNKEGESHFYLDSLGQPSFNVIVRDCPIRTAVTEKDLKQAGPICFLTNGYLCGMLGEILDEKVGMDIEYTGPQACKKRIYFRV